MSPSAEPRLLGDPLSSQPAARQRWRWPKPLRPRRPRRAARARRPAAAARRGRSPHQAGSGSPSRRAAAALTHRVQPRSRRMSDTLDTAFPGWPPNHPSPVVYWSRPGPPSSTQGSTHCAHRTPLGEELAKLQESRDRHRPPPVHRRPQRLGQVEPPRRAEVPPRRGRSRPVSRGRVPRWAKAGEVPVRPKFQQGASGAQSNFERCRRYTMGIRTSLYKREARRTACYSR